jgi:hypothetical protein
MYVTYLVFKLISSHCMTKKDQNLDETDREEDFVIADEYNPIQGGIKQTSVTPLEIKSFNA